MAAKKKRNPQDATRRNVQAANKRFKALLDEFNAVTRELTILMHKVGAIEARLNMSDDFATAQRRLGYVSSTAPKQRIRVK